MCWDDVALAFPGSFEEGLPGESNPVEDIEISEWVFGGFRASQACRRETAVGLVLAICLHVAIPALILLLGFLLAVPSVSQQPFVTVSLVSLPGAGKGLGGSPGAPGSPGAGVSGAEGKLASPNPPKSPAEAPKKPQTVPRIVFTHSVKPAEHISIRKPRPFRRPKEKVERTAEPSAELFSKPAPHRDVVRGDPPDRPAFPPAGGPSAPVAAASGTGQGSKGRGVGAGSLPGSGGGGGRGGSGTGTGSGGLGLNQVDIPPVPIKKVEPQFPDFARQMGISGKVVLRFLVGPDGRVARASVVAAQPQGVFNRCALEAIGEWRFKPGRYRGKPVAVWVELPVSFRLSR
ncbi:MAG: energy transducer TonB [Syntrophobacteraceae bacterium]|nr:energy transducer TonB [Syntrophobacteraceae bacterium]